MKQIIRRKTLKSRATRDLIQFCTVPLTWSKSEATRFRKAPKSGAHLISFPPRDLNPTTKHVHDKITNLKIVSVRADPILACIQSWLTCETKYASQGWARTIQQMKPCSGIRYVWSPEQFILWDRDYCLFAKHITTLDLLQMKRTSNQRSTK